MIEKGGTLGLGVRDSPASWGRLGEKGPSSGRQRRQRKAAATVTGWRKRGEPTSQRRDGKGAERMDVLGQRRRRAGRRREPSAAVSIGGESFLDMVSAASWDEGNEKKKIVTLAKPL
jgi:hypothetical protein